jgi:uncharacterized membrane protein
MKLDRKLAEWREAGLVDAEAVARIEAHERERSSPVVLYAVGGVGAVAIVLGLIAIIASNWAAIPADMKLLVDVLVALGLAVAIVRASPGWMRETLIIVNYGFVLASMSLIGQIYHLDSGTWRALLVWSLATGPLMLLAEGRFAATVWFVGLSTTHGFLIVEWLEWLDAWTGMAEHDLLNVAIVTTGIGPLLYLCVARISWLRSNRPDTAATARAIGWLMVAAMAFVSSLLFYDDVGEHRNALLGLGILFLAYGAFASLLPRFEAPLSAPALLGMRVLLVGGPLLGLLVVVGGWGSWPLLAAVFQVLWLGWMAWTALHAGYEGLFRLGVAGVCLRLLGIYIEVFGSMLQTGLGLILGGVLTVVLTWFWLRKSRGLAAALVDSESSPGRMGGSAR